jgi:peptide-methionine (S)-S-oxide reductase
MRQGNDIGTQYRSVCYCIDDEDLIIIKESLAKYQESLSESSLGLITTELKIEDKYFLAEEYHQQYLDKNPNGYCGLGGTGCELRI